MTNKQTIDGVPRYIGETKLVGNYYPAQCTRCGWLGSSSELTDEAECTRQASEGLCLGYTEEVEASRLLDIIQAMARPATQPQGEPVAIDRISVQMLKGGLFRLDSDPDGPLVRYQDHAEQVESLRLEVGRLNRVKLALAEKVTVHADNCAVYRAQLAEQPAPVAVVPTYKPGLYAVRHIDNWDGERDVALTFAMLDADGKWTDNESGAPLLTYQGDKILRAWPLDCSEAPDTQIIGVSRNWLEDWALELVEAAQDGGTMSNQVEHLLQLHPKQ